MSVFRVFLVRIQFESGKIRTRKTTNMGTCYAVSVPLYLLMLLSKRWQSSKLSIVLWSVVFVETDWFQIFSSKSANIPLHSDWIRKKLKLGKSLHSDIFYAVWCITFSSTLVDFRIFFVMLTMKKTDNNNHHNKQK